MTIKISEEQYWELLKEANQNLLVTDDSNGSDMIWEYSQRLGKGYFQFIELRAGLSLQIFEVEFQENLLVEVQPYQAELEFVFKFAGNGESADGLLTRPAQDYIFSGVYHKGNYKRGTGKTLEVCIHLEPETLRTLLEGYSEPIPPDLEQAIAGTCEQSMLRSDTLTPAKQTALAQILNCPYQGLTRKMYLESKVLELMALKLASVIPQDPSFETLSTQRSQDVERIYQARDILIRNPEDPPSLLDLAKQIGINDWKLKRGFREIFGTTVFGYLHSYRMEMAQQMLQAGQSSVATVANTVGYSNPGHFAAAFKRRFGVTPKNYRLGAKLSVQGSQFSVYE